MILGSATPALETYFAARRGEIGLLSLPQRIRTGEWTDASSTLPFPQAATLGDLPPVSIVDMRQELRAGNRGMFSRALAAGLHHVLQAGQQAILYLNRRGAATFVMCRDCGHVEACPRCAIPLTFHSEGEALVCHHCNRRYPAPTVCAECKGRRIRYFGAGTEHVEETVRQQFPNARTLRWDRDVTGAKGSHDAILSKFTMHEADVLIGTQMIAKGLDLPLVTLVGVVAADTGLFLPDFRAAERTFQLLTQVAGRGRTQYFGWRGDRPDLSSRSLHGCGGEQTMTMTRSIDRRWPFAGRRAIPPCAAWPGWSTIIRSGRKLRLSRRVWPSSCAPRSHAWG